MPDYSNSVVYLLGRKDGTGEYYVGSTCNLQRRRWTHKHSCNDPKERNHNYPVYQHIRANGGWDEWDMRVLEQVHCESREELELRERHWYDQLKPTLNTQAPASVALAGGEKEYQAEYHAAHRERILERHAEYYAANRKRLMERHAEYYAANRKRLLEQKAEYYLANRERILEKVQCECGREVNRCNLSAHRRSAKHQVRMQSAAKGE